MDLICTGGLVKFDQAMPFGSSLEQGMSVLQLKLTKHEKQTRQILQDLQLYK